MATLPPRPRHTTNPRWSATGAVLAAAAAVTFAIVQPLAPPSQPGPDRGPLDNAVVASLDAEINRSFDQLRLVANPGRPQADVVDAGRRLQAQLRPLIPLASQDPATTQRILAVLEAGRTLLAEQSPGALAIYDREAATIIEAIRASATATVAGMLPVPAPPEEQLVRDAVLRVGPPAESDPEPASARLPEAADEPRGESEPQRAPSQQQDEDKGESGAKPTVDLPVDLPVEPPSAPVVDQPEVDEQPEVEVPQPADVVPEPAQVDLPLPQLPAPPIDLEPLTGQ